MGEWKNFTFDEVCSRIYSGGTPSTKNPDYWNGDINWLSSGETGNRYIYKTDRKISEVGAKQSSTKKAYIGSTVVASAGQGYTRGQASFLKIDTYVNQSVIVFQANKDIIDEKFLFFNLDNRYEELRQLSDGTSTRGGLSGWIVKRMEISLPDMNTQKRISSILSAIDDKIELNNQINKNLEQQAQAICDEWITKQSDCITMRPLSEIADINPDIYSPKVKWDYINYLDTSSINNGVISEVQFIRPDTEKLPSRARRILKENDIVYSTVRPNQLHFGIISNPLKNMLASTGFAVIRSKYSYISSPFIYHFLTTKEFIEKMQQLAEQSTSTFPSVKPSDIGSCLIPCADANIMHDISKRINIMYSMVHANYQENQCLAELRDNLLPKLMNGEIDVTDVKI